MYIVLHMFTVVCLYVLTVRGYLPASDDIKDNLMGVDRAQEELQQLNQLKQVCLTHIAKVLCYRKAQNFDGGKF